MSTVLALSGFGTRGRYISAAEGSVAAHSFPKTRPPSKVAICHASAPQQDHAVLLVSYTTPLRNDLNQMVLHRPVETATFRGTCRLRHRGSRTFEPRSRSQRRLRRSSGQRAGRLTRPSLISNQHAVSQLNACYLQVQRAQGIQARFSFHDHVD